MDLFLNLAHGFSVAVTPTNIMLCLIGTLVGTLIGVLPGIGPLATIAMLLPITFGLPPVGALIMLAGIYYGAQYGGSTTSILINIPGESSAVVTTLDGHQMAKQGRAGPALAIAAIGSFFAGCVATVLVVILIPMTIYANRLGKLIPGIAPDVLLAALETVVLVGLAIFVSRFAPRGPVLITAATLIFAISVRPLGLVISSYIAIVVAAHATKEVRLIETLIWAAVLTVFCALLFPYGLNLPLQLWPRI